MSSMEKTNGRFTIGDDPQKEFSALLASPADVTDLYILSDQISDLSSLVNFTNLTYLGVQSNRVRDLSPLAN
jgi:Leucine-rich repeat (LRR) protein